jgi:hypothetical protein
VTRQVTSRGPATTPEGKSEEHVPPLRPCPEAIVEIEWRNWQRW